MKKNYFETLSTIISLVYKVIFVIGTVAGFVLWIVWWRDYKKFLHQDKDDELDKEFPICNDTEPTWFDIWKKTEAELNVTCKKAAEDDDDELY